MFSKIRKWSARKYFCHSVSTLSFRVAINERNSPIGNIVPDPMVFGIDRSGAFRTHCVFAEVNSRLVVLEYHDRLHEVDTDTGQNVADPQ